MRLLALLLLVAAGTPLLARAESPPPPTLQVQPERPRPGDPLLVSVRGTYETPTGSVGGRPLTFFPVEGGHVALTGLPVETAPGPLEVVVRPASRGPALRHPLQVAEPAWRTRELTVARKFTRPPSAALKRRMKADREAFARAFTQPPSPPRVRGRFSLPREATFTAFFGDRRTYNGQTKSQHYGLDIDGDVGDPLHAAHDGKVVMVRDCFASGNTVVVDHGAGLYTAYFHLTRFQVREGQEVRQGDVLGTVGRTGRVTGPHLHWSVKVDGLYVDPQTLLTLDFGGTPTPSLPAVAGESAGTATQAEASAP
jgi:hypothetical protein